ncbi:hypothetical protein CVT26_013519 [Gymnopilus dilepis]|uniref:Uncharacterized protein n=1 Tax=Gymnopilus dilepis TaxID=231916 RepID=A0A409Y5H9_9AGAR|nr:hypothetical protein CVT26_013519 [Gymnopilus dilepis]
MSSTASMFSNILLVVLLFIVSKVFGHSPFDESKWIWANDLTQDGKAPPGSHSFRRTFDNSGVRSPVPCIILITCDDIYHLFLNGEHLGSGNQALQAQAYHASLQPGKNVFAVNATNLLHAPNPAGLLVDVQIPYDGNEIGRIVSDSIWRAHNEVRDGFEGLDYDDSFWPHAAVVSDYGSEPWGNIQVAPLDVACGCPPKSNAALSLTNANWIWTNEIRGGNAPVGARAFRRELSLPRGLKATGVKILIGVDDHFTLYVQGHRVGSGEVWSAAHTFDVTLGKPTSEVVIAVDAANAEGGPAGLVADIQLVIDGCEGSPVPVASDGSWKYSVTVPKSFESIDYDDSGWSLATVEGRYGMSPWAQLSMPYGIVQSKV